MIKEDLGNSIINAKMAKAEFILEKENGLSNFSIKEVEKLANQLTAIIFCNKITKDKLIEYVKDFENVEFFVSKAIENDGCYIDVYKKELLVVID